jgi:hypothetical protein
MGTYLSPKGETRIKIDGEIWTVDEIITCGDLPLIRCGRVEFYLAASSEEAGKAARERWAEGDRAELRCILGDETLIAWALGDWAGPGSRQVRSFSEWLDLWLDSPEEEFASYDGEERVVQRCAYLRDELGFVPTVAYRHN